MTVVTVASRMETARDALARTLRPDAEPSEGCSPEGLGIRGFGPVIMAAGPPGRRAAGPPGRRAALPLRPRCGHERARMAALAGPSVLPA